MLEKANNSRTEAIIKTLAEPINMTVCVCVVSQNNAKHRDKSEQILLF